MDAIASNQLTRVHGGENLFQALGALRRQPRVPIDQQYQSTLDFIAQHPFFHHRLMNAPIGHGKHFRNVAFIGPAETAWGKITHNRELVQRGREITRATHDAP